MKVCYVYNGDYNGDDEGEGFGRKLSLELEARGVEVYLMRPFMRHHTEQTKTADECEAAVVYVAETEEKGRRKYSAREAEFPAYYAGRFAGQGKPAVVAQSHYKQKKASVFRRRMNNMAFFCGAVLPGKPLAKASGGYGGHHYPTPMRMSASAESKTSVVWSAHEEILVKLVIADLKGFGVKFPERVSA